ncbi:MAG: lactonase family protein [Vicinamibacterales bacterium]
MRTLALALLLIVAAHADSVALRAHDGTPAAEDRLDRGGLVYVMTNASGGNFIVVFGRDRRGRLHPLPGARVATGGKGGGDNAPIDPLGSQGSLVHAAHLDMLFAVNAGDHTVSAFDTSAPGVRPRRTALVASGGYLPVSVAVSGRRLYVLNAGGVGSVVTFAIDASGNLRKLGTLELGLSNATAIPFDQVMAPGQVGVDALTRRIVITHAAGQELLTADLDDRGIAVESLTSTPTPGIVPFAFGITRHGIVVVAEAGSGSVSAFDGLTASGPLPVTAAAVPTGQAATCWLVVHPRGHVYAANTGADTISRYRVSRTGGLVLVDAVAANVPGAPADITLANHGGFLYTLNLAAGSISGFAVNRATGALTLLDEQTGGLPAAAGIQGIAARDF